MWLNCTSIMVNFDSKFIHSLESRMYWEPTKSVCDEAIIGLRKYGNEIAEIEVLNHLSQIMWDSSEGVGKIQAHRIRRGEIEDGGQSSVSVAGNNFQALVGYCLERNRIIGNIPEDIEVVLRPRQHSMIKQYATIDVGGGESQRPDVDILLYSKDEDTPLIICSCKTSLRERAGQTYRWKLLLDMALCNCKHKKGCPMSKYNLSYSDEKEINVILITADFYDERENPQQRGMFTFFDNVYVSKPIEEFANVKRLSKIIDLINIKFK